VRRGVKVIVWILVFTACAGAGAYVAAHTNPFPPGVEDPGARPTTPPPTTQVQTEGQWSFVLSSSTRHELHVGGACRSGWTTSGSIAIAPDGSVAGHGVAQVHDWGCDFPVAQIQTRIVRLAVRGSLSGNVVSLGFSIEGSGPPGSQDLGGFTATVRSLSPTVPVSDGRGHAVAREARPDGDLGRYVNDSRIQLACATGC
jgi:hypothetical protein